MYVYVCMSMGICLKLGYNSNADCLVGIAIIKAILPGTTTTITTITEQGSCAGLQERTVEIRNRAGLDAMAELMDIETTFNREGARKNKPEGNAHEKLCAQSGYTGYTKGNNNVGSIKMTFKRSGVGTLNYGNCWDEGNAQIYFNDIYEEQTGNKDVNNDFKFAFREGDVIELRDEGW